MGEIPIFTSNAHVFNIDPVTKKSWIATSQSSAQVNFFFDSSRKTYRIICVEGSKAIINSTVTGDMQFMKTSAKFGQWVDVQANTVYGLGFASDTLLNAFAEQFDTTRDKAKNLQQILTVKPKNGIADSDSDRSKEFNKAEDSSNSQNGDACFDVTNLAASFKQLQIQNEKLKQSLSQGTASLKKKDAEIAAVKNTNKQLTTALQDSMASGNDLCKQSNTFKEENESLRNKVKDLEEKLQTSSSGDELNKTLKQMDALKQEHREKCQECNMLQQRVGVLSVVEKQHNECASAIKKSFDENQHLRDCVDGLHEKIDELLEEKKAKHSMALECCAQLTSYLTDMTEVTQKFQENI